MQRVAMVILNGARCFHTCKSLNSMQRTMKKIMGFNGKKKHRYNSELPLMPSPNVFSEGARDGKRSSNSRRSHVLNKLFMKHITDLMMTGESCGEFAGYGIEVNRVQVTPDFKGINVFWVAKGTENDEVIEKILLKNSGQLRHELTQLRVIGAVPRIYFVKDKQYAQIMEVDVRLAKADFGPDHVPLEPAIKLRAHFELNMKLEPHLKERIEKLESEEAADDESNETIPQMPQNVFGLNHHLIMDRVMKSMTKSQAAHRSESASDISLEKPSSYNLHPFEYVSSKATREAFRQFLAQRQILLSKAHREEKNYQPEHEYLEGEWYDREKQDLDSFNNASDFDDYIDGENEGVK